MNTSQRIKISSLALAAGIFSVHSADAVWITNFTSLTSGPGGSASGAWRDVTNTNTGDGVDTGFVVNLTTTGDVKATTDPTLPSRIDESFPWRDIAAFETVTLPDGTSLTTPFAIDLPFATGTNGDFVNIETNGGSFSVVTFNFGARITNPMLSFSDIDVNTVMTFTDTFTVADSTSNLASSPLTVSNNGTMAPIPFEEEAAGSLQFTGTFTQLQFIVANNATPGTEDRTGFVVSTDFIPEAIPEPSSALLMTLGGFAFLLRRKK